MYAGISQLIFYTLQRIANSIKIRSGVPIDIKNRIEEALFLSNVNSETIRNIKSFRELIRQNYRNADLKFFTPMKDGAYPILKSYDYEKCLAISIGVGNNILLDSALASLGCEVHMFDHTIDNVKIDRKLKSKLIFHKIGLAAESQGNLMSLGTIIEVSRATRKTRISVLKIDCEGCEWSSLNDSAIQYLVDVDQLIIEFHFFDRFNDKAFSSQALELFSKLTRLFNICYISPNNFGGSVDLGANGIWPFTLEFMLVNRKIVHQHLNDENNIPKLRNWRLGKSIDIVPWTSNNDRQ